MNVELPKSHLVSAGKFYIQAAEISRSFATPLHGSHHPGVRVIRNASMFSLKKFRNHRKIMYGDTLRAWLYSARSYTRLRGYDGFKYVVMYVARNFSGSAACTGHCF